MSRYASTWDVVHVTVTKDTSNKLGIVLVPVAGTNALTISALHKEGLIREWNKRHPEAEVAVGHWVVEVNGEVSTSSMASALQRTGDLHLVVAGHRSVQVGGCDQVVPPPSPSAGEPFQYRVKFRKEEGTSLGCNLLKGTQGMTVLNIADGLVKAWNDRHPGREILTGDRIVRVNGRSQNDMIPELAKLGPLSIVFRRGPADDHELQDVLPLNMVNALPRSGWKQCCSSDVCGVCLEDWEIGDQALNLPCKHQFHPDCITPWLTMRSVRCPLCKWATDCELDSEESEDKEESEVCDEELARPKLLPPALVVRPPFRHTADVPPSRDRHITSL